MLIVIADGSVPHQYADKFGLAEQAGTVAIGGIVNGRHKLGVSPAMLENMKGWSEKSTVSLKFEFTETWKFMNETVRKVEAEIIEETEVTIFTMSGKTKKTTLVKSVTEYYYALEVGYHLTAAQVNSAKE